MSIVSLLSQKSEDCKSCQIYIQELSISDLKSAYDFVIIDMQELEKSAKEKGISVNEIPAYEELRNLENKLFHKLLNIVRGLE